MKYFLSLFLFLVSNVHAGMCLVPSDIVDQLGSKSKQLSVASFNKSQYSRVEGYLKNDDPSIASEKTREYYQDKYQKSIENYAQILTEYRLIYALLKSHCDKE